MRALGRLTATRDSLWPPLQPTRVETMRPDASGTTIRPQIDIISCRVGDPAHSRPPRLVYPILAHLVVFIFIDVHT